MDQNTPTVFNDRTTRVMLAVLQGARSVRQVQDATQTSSLATVHRHLCKLQQAGLVDWTATHQFTLHPTARALPISTTTRQDKQCHDQTTL
jgi:DNA-binding IclR family transcriptional regulator